MIIFKKRGRFCFRDEAGTLRKFQTLEDAVEAGGTEEKVAVSGVPYKVDSFDVEINEDE